MSKTTTKLARAFTAVFLVVFGWLLFNIVCANPHFTYRPWVTLPLAALVLLTLFGVWRLLQKYETQCKRYEGICLAVFFGVLALTLFYFYTQLACYPVRDLERVYTGAYNYTIAGVIEDPYLDYFYKFPNNLPVTVVLQFLFRAVYRLFGVTDFLPVGALLNGACIVAMYVFTYLCCRKLLGVRQGFFALALCYGCLPLHFLIGYFYTDTLTMPLMPLVFYLYLCARDTKGIKRVVILALLGICAAFGTALKYTVLIVVIAIGIDVLLHKRWKLLAAIAGCFAGALLLWTFAFNSFIDAHILDAALAQDRATPPISWVMMGLKGDGTHNAADNYLVWNYPTKAEKTAAATEELQKRLAAYGVPGYLRFLNQKGVRSFGSGNLDVTNTVALSPMRQGFWVECVSADGKYYAVCDNLMQGYYAALFALVLAAAVYSLRKQDFRMLVPLLALFGLYLFLLLWEADHRYLINMMPAFFIAATGGARCFEYLPFKRNAQLDRTEKQQR